jgi:hypothetical protein
MYGYGTSWYKMDGVSGGIGCDNADFGDPNYGYHKTCYYSVGPVATSWCASEGNYCTFQGTYDVTYGADTHWTTQHSVVGETSCSNDVFGDPDYGYAKNCFTVDGSGSGGSSSSGPSANGPPGYSAYCAAENQHCYFSGTKDVAYGADPSCTSCWAIQHSVTGGVDCNNNQFGDPDYGTVKACYTKDQTTTGGSTGPRPGYTYCADENTHCYFSGTMDVAYGRDGHFNFQYGVTNGIDCNNANFGDPDYGYAKACYTASTTSSGSQCGSGVAYSRWSDTYSNPPAATTGDAWGPITHIEEEQGTAANDLCWNQEVFNDHKAWGLTWELHGPTNVAGPSQTPFQVSIGGHGLKTSGYGEGPYSSDYYYRNYKVVNPKVCIDYVNGASAYDTANPSRDGASSSSDPLIADAARDLAGWVLGYFNIPDFTNLITSSADAIGNMQDADSATGATCGS